MGPDPVFGNHCSRTGLYTTQALGGTELTLIESLMTGADQSMPAPYAHGKRLVKKPGITSIPVPP